MQSYGGERNQLLSYRHQQQYGFHAGIYPATIFFGGTREFWRQRTNWGGATAPRSHGNVPASMYESSPLIANNCGFLAISVA